MVGDASVWVSAIVAEDDHHPMSRRWLDEQPALDVVLVIPTLAFTEVAGAIARRTGLPLNGSTSSAVPTSTALGRKEFSLLRPGGWSSWQPEA